MIKVFFTNHWYYAAPDFAQFDDAVEYAKEKGFDAALIVPHDIAKPYAGGTTIALWSILGGLRDMRETVGAQ